MIRHLLTYFLLSNNSKYICFTGNTFAVAQKKSFRDVLQPDVVENNINLRGSVSTNKMLNLPNEFIDMLFHIGLGRSSK